MVAKITASNQIPVVSKWPMYLINDIAIIYFSVQTNSIVIILLNSKKTADLENVLAGLIRTNELISIVNTWTDKDGNKQLLETSLINEIGDKKTIDNHTTLVIEKLKKNKIVEIKVTEDLILKNRESEEINNK